MMLHVVGAAVCILAVFTYRSNYGVATISRMLQNIGLFCRI